jgi:hypothetical protein
MREFWKGIFHANQNVQGGERLILFQQAYSVELKKHICLLKENQLC